MISLENCSHIKNVYLLKLENGLKNLFEIFKRYVLDPVFSLFKLSNYSWALADVFIFDTLPKSFAKLYILVSNVIKEYFNSNHVAKLNLKIHELKELDISSKAYIESLEQRLKHLETHQTSLLSSRSEAYQLLAAQALEKIDISKTSSQVKIENIELKKQISILEEKLSAHLISQKEMKHTAKMKEAMQELEAFKINLCQNSQSKEEAQNIFEQKLPFLTQLLQEHIQAFQDVKEAAGTFSPHFELLTESLDLLKNFQLLFFDILSLCKFKKVEIDPQINLKDAIAKLQARLQTA